MIKRTHHQKKNVSETQKGYASIGKSRVRDRLRYLLKQVKGID